ncbi:DUF1064 domain-containing protein [Martelella limonii]|uniref:DUF1064 domain-containing protein n=1 Tax=Martelella limonii TaxID=1647649 RepID=UPI001FCE8316|nr:DUF1064 domain-containing protein [Martelella limonii]
MEAREMTERMTAAEAREHLKPAKQNKYRNKPVVIDGIRFDSTAEGNRYNDLKTLQKAGEIVELQRQVSYRLDVNGEHVCAYKADFVYFDCREKRTVVEDVKGVRTKDYEIKKKLMRAVHGIEIQEISA